MNGIVDNIVPIDDKVDKTKGASDQFFDIDFYFLVIWAAQGSKWKNPIMNYEQLLSSVFPWFQCCSIRTKKFHKITFILFIIIF